MKIKVDRVFEGYQETILRIAKLNLEIGARRSLFLGCENFIRELKEMKELAEAFEKILGLCEVEMEVPPDIAEIFVRIGELEESLGKSEEENKI